MSKVLLSNEGHTLPGTDVPGMWEEFHSYWLNPLKKQMRAMPSAREPQSWNNTARCQGQISACLHWCVTVTLPEIMRWIMTNIERAFYHLNEKSFSSRSKRGSHLTHLICMDLRTDSVTTELKGSARTGCWPCHKLVEFLLVLLVLSGNSMLCLLLHRLHEVLHVLECIDL